MITPTPRRFDPGESRPAARSGGTAGGRLPCARCLELIEPRQRPGWCAHAQCPVEVPAVQAGAA